MNPKDKKVQKQVKGRETKGSFPRVFYLLPLLHLVIALPLAFCLNIWIDEASTLNTTENGFFAALQYTLRDEQQAPLYFWILSLWREISGSIFFARIFSIICSVLAIGVFFRLTRKLWNEKIAIFTTFFFALHPYLFWASLEIRVYSLLILLSVLLLKLFFDGYLNFDQAEKLNGNKITESEEKLRKFARNVFPTIAIISLYVNYYLGIILVACFFVLLVFKQWRVAKTYFLQMLIVGIFFLPMLWALKIQLAIRNSEYFPETNVIEGIRLLWGHFLMLVVPTEIFPSDDITMISYLRLWVMRISCIVVLVTLIAKRKLFSEKIIIFGTISTAIFCFLYFSYFLLGGSMVAVRHVSILFVPLTLLLISVFLIIAPKIKKTRLYYYAFIAVLLTCSYAYALFSLHPNLTKTGDWARVGKFIEQNEKSDQPIVIFPNFEAMALPYHYKGKNKILPNENFHKWFPEAERGTARIWTKQINYYFSIIPKDSTEIWLLTYRDCQSTKACLPLEKYVEANYTIIKQKDFYNERVRLLKKR